MINKVNQLLSLFGHDLGPLPTERNEEIKKRFSVIFDKK